MNESSTPFVPLKFIAEIVSGGTPKPEATNWGGELPFITPPDLNGLDGTVIERWDRSLTQQGVAGSVVVNNAVLLSCRAPIGHIGIAIGDVAFNQGCKAIIPEQPDDIRYLAHCLVAYRKALQAAGRGTTFTELSTTELSSFAIPWPSEVRRTRLADYLDRETGEIDAMIGKMDELADALGARAEEFRARELLRATERRGLRWMVLEINTGPFGTQVKQADYISDGVPLINPSHIATGRIVAGEGVTVTSSKAEELSRFRLNEGDIVVARRGDLGRAAVVLADDLPAICGTGSLRIRPNVEQALPEYVCLVVSSREAVRELEQLSVGTTMGNLNERLLGEVHVPVMTIVDQRKLLARVDEVTGRIDAMLAKVAELRTLLIERRAALITDVVTGRKVVA